MHCVLRNINQRVKDLATRIPHLATTKELLVQHPHVLFRRTSTQQPHQDLRDFGIPNPSWSQEMMDQFEKFTKMSEDGLWQRIPSYNNCVDSMPVRSKLGYKPRKHQDACLFVRNVATEGRGFEFAMFYNGSERRMVVLLQAGSYLEGMIGFMHGGAVAAILDHTFVGCGICTFGIMVTANLSVDYKSPIPLGSVVLVESKVEKVEERKIFLSGSVQSTDAQNLHAEATALLIHLDTKTSSHPVTNSN
ncbi:acyl-coenzyme A thioesterase THEM4-like [Pituophis catenifer annectens]|uniref:acyl-coenzyme A thioesterase THEM4-like n=1 Tax=Pituophis catenifer annectens TaxID=94852 RepID=UPI003991747B